MIPLALILIALGILTLLFGSRLVLLGAATGALLGIAVLRFLPGSQGSWLWLVIPVGLAVLFALSSGMAKGLIGLVSLAIGALAGGSVVFAVMDLFGLDLGLLGWGLALVGAVIGAGFMSRFKKWTVMVLAGVIGALLCVRGLQMMVPFMQGSIASLVGLLLAGAGIAYQGGILGGKG